MKRMKLIALGLAVGLIGAVVSAEWGNGLGGEYKQILVPEQQQSGWGIKTESAKPQQVSQAPATSAPVAAVPVAAAPAAAFTTITEKTWTLHGVQFESGSDKLKAESKETLDQAAGVLQTNARVVVEIQGHTDNVGDAAANKALSEKRAAAVQNYLVAKGIPAERLDIKGFGEDNPIADNSTTEGRAQNRRIQFLVISE